MNKSIGSENKGNCKEEHDFFDFKQGVPHVIEGKNALETTIHRPNLIGYSKESARLLKEFCL